MRNLLTLMDYSTESIEKLLRDANAIKNAKKVYLKHLNDTPANSESCTTVYKFFDHVDERLNELM